MNFKKKVSGSWVDAPYYLKGTDTDTLTTLPAVLYPNAATATVGLKGNTVQNGTPTSQNPVMPQGTGDKTANLFSTILPLMNIDSNGQIIADINQQFDLWIAQVTAGEVYTASAVNGCYAFYAVKPSVGSISIDGTRILTYNQITFTVPNGANYIAVRYSKNSTGKMCNAGSTLLPYQPFGYKIPISSANTTTPIYLGEVETTRRIKKYEFTGQETGWNYSTSGGRTRAYIALSDSLGASLCICSHYDYVASSIFYPDIDKFTLNATGSILIGLDSTIYTDVTAFKSYLAAQYAAGTPVTIWYVLAEPTTGIVNEPLMRIGDYADSISGISIPTTAGANTLDVDTTVKPSEVSAEFSGWHPVSSAHERENGAWD